jgi:SOS response regulatory protein OraA/RecX
MDRESYIRGFEDAIETVLDYLRHKNLLSDEVRDAIYLVLAVAKEDKLKRIRKDLGLF